MKTTRGAIRTFDRLKGLNSLHRDFQKKFMATQCRDLVSFLDDAIEMTATNYETRVKPLLVKHHPTDSKAGKRREDTIERMLFERFKSPVEASTTPYWSRIVDYQVSLKNTSDSSWGKIDLLALGTDNSPVVIEVKAETSRVTPAAFLIQAAAYTIALKMVWASGFAGEWGAVITDADSAEIAFPEMPNAFQAVCLAPEKYWEHWTRDFRQQWAAPLEELIPALKKRGIAVTLASFTAQEHRVSISTIDVATWQVQS